MYKLRIKTIAAACGLALAASGCTFLNYFSQSQRAVVPVSNVTHSAAVTDPNYQIGRSSQAKLQYDAAIAAYQKSLEANPGNAEAHNALGVIYASQGKHEQAVIELKAALALAPAAAHIHNNLGYAYLVQGRNADAVAALKVASGLNPDNERVRENMKIAEQRLGREAPNPQVAMAAGVEVKSAPTEKDGGHSTARLLSVAPNIYELRQGSPLQVERTSPLQVERTSPLQVERASPLQVERASPLPTEIASETMRLEIANGNGVSGIAQRAASSLKRKGFAVIRLTDHVPYSQMITEIQYRQGYENQARQLNALLSSPARVVEANLGDLRRDISVRLVLGRDAVERSLVTEADTRNLVASR